MWIKCISIIHYFKILWTIAEKFYKDGSKYKIIFNANRDIISDEDKIQIGQRLRIPAPEGGWKD